MNRLIAPSATTLLLLLLAACRSSEPSDGFGVRAIQFQDVVVPDGFRLGPDSNSNVGAGGYRFGRFVYTGTPRVEDASAYVLDRMPQHAWTLASNSAPDQFSRVLRFNRGSYQATYTIRREEGITRIVVDYVTEIESRQP